MSQVYPAQRSQKPPFPWRGVSPVLASIVGTGESILIVLGCLFGLPILVFPWTALRIRRSVANGQAIATRWALGALVSGLMLLLGVGLCVAVAATADEPAVDVIAWVFAAIGVIPLVTGLGMVLTSGRSRARMLRATRAQQTRVVVDKHLFDDSELSRRVEGALRELSSLVPVYADYRIDGVPVSEKLGRIVEEFQELIRRLDARGTPHQVRMAKAQFAAVLEKVVLCVSPEHLKDVIDNPHLWPHPEQRVAAVGAMLDDVSAEIVENIRQVNSRTDLNFQVALTSLNAITRDAEFARLIGGTS
ncbi:hypothetical protein [Xylanimonas sp. McL0601]|uniref:hypothetical protein n=1 Tax=Xylanimonas sp. McL0601 TaxID=3414739 RepID=UPI003CF2866E